MKKIIFSLFFFSIMAVGAQAQKASCAKTCTKSAAASASCQTKAPSSVATTTSGIEYHAAAAKLAAMDATIETKTDPVTGNVSYVKKETCSHSGSVSYVDVSYDAPSNTFVNVSPVKMEGTVKSSCAGKATTASGKASCAAKTGAVKTAEKVKS